MNLGQIGENLVAENYKSRGYKIIDRNVRLHGARQIGEIDLIAIKGKLLVFVEVKTRKSERFGFAAESVDRNKQKKLVRSAKLYILKNRQFIDFDWQVDVGIVDIDKPGEPVTILTNVIEDLD